MRGATTDSDATTRPPAVEATRPAASRSGSRTARSDLRRALSYLGWARTPGEVRRAAAAGGAALGCLLAAFAAVMLPRYATALAPGALAVAVGVAVGGPRLPVALARFARTRALGDATWLVGRAVLRMRLEPTVERGARFAARTGEGPLARSLGRHVRQTTGTPESGFAGFAAAWGSWFPALERSAALLAAGAAAPPGDRQRTLDRALDAVAEGTRERMAAFSVDLRAPATGLYAFGVLLPLALVGVLPAVGVAGAGVPVWAVVAVYDGCLPVGLVVAGGWLLSRRPVAFPPPAVDRSHPDVPNGRRRAPLAGAAGAASGWVVGPAFVAPWTAPVAAVGFGAGAALVAHYRPATAVRRRVRAVESGLADAMALVGRRVAEGESVESALTRAAADVPGATGEMLGRAARIQRTLRVGVREAFLGERGALATLPSRRVRGAAALLALAADEGRPAGAALVALADQLETLERIEREARRDLAQVTTGLANTAALFAPLIGGATVALAEAMAARRATAATTSTARATTVASGTAPSAAAHAASAPAAFTPEVLGLVVGAYVLALAVVLTALATGLDRGLDRALVGYRIGGALCAATATYLAAVVGAGLLV